LKGRYVKVVKQNCWEFKKCGREPGGMNSAQMGVCVAHEETRTDGVNGGKNGGRSCWAIAGTLCGGTVQGTFAQKSLNCLRCDFYKTVQREEGSSLASSHKILDMLQVAC
jgi:hypothetical protein